MATDRETEVITELRQEIRRVILPQNKERKITIIMPDGKKVKQVKSEDEQFEPVPLKLEASTKKGNIYLRPDGKSVRLVKSKEKRRKEKLKREKMKEVASIMRKEGEVRLAKQQQQQQQQDGLETECDFGDLSWQQVEEIKECILREAWERERSIESDKTNCNRFLSSNAMHESNVYAGVFSLEQDFQESESDDGDSFYFETDSEEEDSSPLDANEPLGEEDSISTTESMEQDKRDIELHVEADSKQDCETDDEDSFTGGGTPVATTKAGTPFLGKEESFSALELARREELGDKEDLNDPALCKGKDLNDSNASTLATVSIGQDEEDEEEFQKFCDSLGSKEKEDQQQKQKQKQQDQVCLPFTKRMSLRSMDVLDSANKMKRISRYAEALADLSAERLKSVSKPKHPTQSN